MSETVAAYVRSSTEGQTVRHQRDDIRDWGNREDINSDSIDWYVDFAQSGADPGREQFEDLINSMHAGAYDVVAVWEISRLARLGSTYQQFFEVAEESETIVQSQTDGSMKSVPVGAGN
ncbi:recombinase family protein [Natronorubrum sediminis]|uniref:recombinase family protein n=1 Tax=Natronorubrum sediminis TaxID=640943 RepID=UPI000A9002BF|nr:recombinase family protein [Natronorubrum sediminis]